MYKKLQIFYMYAKLVLFFYHQPKHTQYLFRSSIKSIQVSPTDDFNGCLILGGLVDTLQLKQYILLMELFLPF